MGKTLHEGKRHIRESGFLVCFAFENSRRISSASDQVQIDSK